MQNKERNFCFVYFGSRMHTPDFNLLKFSCAEGCSEQNGDRTIQFVRISLHPKNGRRKTAIPKIIDEYNRMDGRTERVNPIVAFPQFHDSPVVCFKSTAPIGNNPILQRIALAKQDKEHGFWRWTSTTGGGVAFFGPAGTDASVLPRRRFIISIHEILMDIQLPESLVPVQRVYDELSEPYFRHFGVPLGEGTGCVPVEHREFVVSEIKRLFEEELSYIEHPPVAQKGALPPHALSLVNNAGWMGDILLSGVGMEMVTGGAMIHSVRLENAAAKRRYARTGRTRSDWLESRGVGASLREFLVFYALHWNESDRDSVHQSIEILHDGWTNARESYNTLQSLLSGAGLSSFMMVEDGMLRVPSVERLMALLCDEGLIAPSAPRFSAMVEGVKRMTVLEDSTPVACIVRYFQDKIEKEWAGAETVEVSAIDIVRALNGGDVGVYRRSCVPQFMRPFIFDGSVEAFFWREAGTRHEKYIINVARVAHRLKIPSDCAS